VNGGTSQLRGCRDHELRRRVDAVVLDLHGVIIRGNKLIPGADRALADLRRLGIALAFLTNASARNSSQFSRLLRSQGIDVGRGEIVTAGGLLARRCKEIAAQEASVVRFGGGRALADELALAGIGSTYLHDIDDQNDERPVIFVLGYARRFTLSDAKAILRLSRRVIAFLAAERDRWYAGSDGPTPGVGWIVAAAEDVLDRKSEVVGKPSAYALTAIAEDLACSLGRLLMVGDSVESDVGAARNAGTMACLVASVASPEADVTITHIGLLPELIATSRDIPDCNVEAYENG
jgi:HAD superfamily hydrolase (TIGR01450 family)